MYCFYLKSPTGKIGEIPGTWMTAEQEDVSTSDSSSMPDSAALPVDVPVDSLLGDWIDSDGSAVQVQRLGGSNPRLQAVVSRTMQPSVVLDLEQESESSSGWRCGDATLQSAWSSNMQLTWRFQDGRTWQWTREASMWQCYGQGGVDQSYQQGMGNFHHGPYVQQDGTVSLSDLAWHLSGGATTTMMMPVFAEPESS
eukprot:TRINITY_DN87159_c0_g1_i1.p1 TRINITY_DN87159_c0_g1~~TRINITY_DN87159_c0_g1_i1.p1  ORF type:complete len:197 (-),score=45.57 TRINITY_DN87159_c0_g1_i1:15-605(-)